MSASITQTNAEGVVSTNLQAWPNNATPAANAAQAELNYNPSVSGGSGVVSTLRVNTEITEAPTYGFWGILSQMSYNGSGTTGGNGGHVPVYGQGVRGNYNAGGAPNNPQIWGGVFESHDTTGQPSSATNAQVGAEVDLICNGLDDADNRIGLVVVCGQHNPNGAPAQIGYGISLHANINTSLIRGLNMNFPYSQAGIDFRGSVQQGGNAIWLADGQTISFNTAGTATIAWSGAAIQFSRPIFAADGVQINNHLTLPTLVNAANDAAAKAAGVAVNNVYRNGSQLMIRVS